jgi:hypothetical protein
MLFSCSINCKELQFKKSLGGIHFSLFRSSKQLRVAAQNCRKSSNFFDLFGNPTFGLPRYAIKHLQLIYCLLHRTNNMSFSRMTLLCFDNAFFSKQDSSQWQYPRPSVEFEDKSGISNRVFASVFPSKFILLNATSPFFRRNLKKTRRPKVKKWWKSAREMSFIS